MGDDVQRDLGRYSLVMSQPQSRTDDPRSLVESHFALFVAGMTSLVVILRILAISAFQPWTALAVLTSAGAPGVLLGTMILMVPYLLPFVAMLSYWVFRERRDAASREAWGLLAIIAGAISLVATPVLILFIFGGTLLADLVLRRRRARAGEPGARPPIPLYRRFAPVALYLIGIVWAYPTPWIATEKIVDKTHGVLTGYVLATDSRWTHVLQTEPRTVTILETDAITGRSYCQNPIEIWGVTLRLLPYLNQLPPGMPPC